MSGPYTREAWNNIISQVNDLCANPPSDTDCEPLSPLPTVGPEHIWTKTDIQDVRAKLGEICSRSWSAELRLWTQELVDELTNAIGAGWCDCEPDDEECRPDCSNAMGLVSISGGSATQTGCIDITGMGPSGATSDERAFIAEMGGTASYESGQYSIDMSDHCMLEDEVQALKDELDDLKKRLTNEQNAAATACAPGGDPDACAEAQAKVADTQIEISIKNAEITDKQFESDEKKAEADAHLSAADAAASACMSAYAGITVHGGTSLSYVGSVPTAEWVGRECSDMGTPCHDRNPARCQPSYWKVMRKTTSVGQNGTFTGKWSEVVRGGYTPTGGLYIVGSVSEGESNGVSNYLCSSQCLTGDCHPAPCWNACLPSLSATVELRVDVQYPYPAGEQCC